MARIYGDLPENLGFIDIPTDEMLNWLYCPISTPNTGVVIPENLSQFQPIIDAVRAREPHRFHEEYVYITAKTLYVEGTFVGNRPGWHADGFGTDDLNFIWYDSEPTWFYGPTCFTLPNDCTNSMELMAKHALGREIVTYPVKNLLRLTPSVIHQPPPSVRPGMRTFVKVSISPDRYNLIGNSINHNLGERWPLIPRTVERNHPAAK
jgi:hypothetical protein